MSYFPGSGGSGSLTMISDKALGGTTAPFSFTSIPQTYKGLLVVMVLRGNSASSGIFQAAGQINGVSTSNYHSYYSDGGANATPTGQESVGASSGCMGFFVGANSPMANGWATTVLRFNNYTNGNICPAWTFLSWAIANTTTGNNIAAFGGGVLNTVGAISSLSLASGAGTFSAGSRATLYGVS